MTPSSWITPKAAKGVRSAIAGHDWRQPDLLRKYRGYFSWYLQRRIQDQ